MECELPALLQLPQEIRDEIYKYILLEEEEIQHEARAKYSRRMTPSWSVRQPRYQARIVCNRLKDGPDVQMSCPAALSEVNRQIRVEVSDFLENSKLSVVARVRNFDFDHVLRYLATPATRRTLTRHAVREDGTVPHRMVIELSGPYDDDGRANLQRWIEGVDGLMQGRSEELGVLHKTAFQGRFKVCAPAAIVWKVGAMYEAWPLGAGRLESEKVFFALYTRWEVEVMMNWQSSMYEATYDAVVKEPRSGWSFR